MTTTDQTWPALLSRLLLGEDLSTADAAWAMGQVMEGEASPARLAAFLTALRAKGETVAEMRGLADMMLEHAHRFEVTGPALDIVGTGGDGAHTVNISTMSSIVAAAAGVQVVKHGNRAASSRAGSADTLAALGVRLDLTPEQVATVGRACGITFCFAQTFHPSMRHAASVRRDLGIATAFNYLGPLTNPAQPSYAAIGVADQQMAPLLAGVFADRGLRAAVFRGDDGLDEVTPATTTSVWWVGDRTSHRLSLDPTQVGVGPHPVDALRGGDPEHNAAVALRVLSGESGPVRDAVLLNAGLALAVVASGETGMPAPQDSADLHRRLSAGMARAAAAIDSGRATQTLRSWAETTAAQG